MESWDWTLFPLPDVGSERFRLTQTGGRNLHNGYGLIGSFYSDGDFVGRFGWQRIYPDWDGSLKKILFSQPFPPDLLNAGINTRYLGCSLRSRPVLNGPWKLFLEAEILTQSVQWETSWIVKGASLTRSGDFVELKGFATPTTVTTGTIGFLPFTFRPVTTQVYQNIDSGREANLTITPTGEIIVVSGVPPYRLDIIFRNKL